ncbi:MAG: NAD-dependent epimerase/dehydratase family protein [Candidatus Thorarchaeota archaeon]
MQNDKTVLVTGALGFLGKTTVQLLVEGGYLIWGLDLPGTEIPRFFKNLESSTFNLIEGNILDDDLDEIFPQNIDFVIHLAGLKDVQKSFDEPELFEKVNVDGTVRILDACKNRDIKRFIFSSSAAVYGTGTEFPITEDHTLAPMNPYGRSKALAEQKVSKLGAEYSIETTCLRFFNIYGLNQPIGQSGLISSFVNSIKSGEDIVIYGSGKRKRSFVHVEDAARSLILACEAENAAGHTFNICGDISISVTDLAKEILRLSGRTDLQIINKKMDRELAGDSICSGELATKILGYTPRIQFTEGLQEVLIAYLES